MKEVIILGHGPTRLQCDYHCEVFGVNTTYNVAKRLDKLFIVDKVTDAEFDFKALAQVKCIVSSIPYPDHPEWNIEVYPLKEILNHFKTTFFSNAICYMIAYALYHKYERIYFYGIDMMTSTSYLFEKGGVEYWMGIAHALGVPIINTKESATGKTIDGKMYGYWGPDLDNLGSFTKAVAEESQRLVKNMTGAVDVKIDPDGHLAAKNETVRKHLITNNKEAKQQFVDEVVNEQRRDLTLALGFHDQSEEWVKGNNGDWVRREIKVVKQ